jgi:peptide/nickel transport system substrate-binding protein
MTKFKDFIPSGDFSGFTQAKIAVASVDGPTQVKIGADAPFTVTVTFDNKPYASADLDKVSYTLLGADGSVIASGVATMSQEGTYTIDLTPDITGKLTAGSASLSVAVASNVVALPTFVTYQFVVTQ